MFSISSTLHGAQDLFLAFSSRITPGGAQGKHLIPWPILFLRALHLLYLIRAERELALAK